ncbi:hypothetical protein LTR84_000314 [Exophiala bonariae]|uniref:Uncharacterized protein n=1 Tax=Exophiala bonariae TaxID=1690606 RepID=A0AAV9NQW7_9EURO|nr:hypothetical protein LTR84_000314 [Exophiala bonariae]
MLSDWTGDQINPVFDKDTFSNEFETFGVQASPTTAPEIERLNGDVMVKKFVDGTQGLPDGFGRIRILCTRHRDYLRREIKPAHAAFRGVIFAHVLEEFHLPSTYQQIRTHANASGAFFKFTERGSDGSVQRIGKNELQRSLYELEVRLGVTRGRPQILPARRAQDTILLLEANTMNCNHIVTSLVYLERRLSFAKSAAERITKLMPLFLDTEISLTKGDNLTYASLDFEEIVGNGLSLVDNQTNLTLCLLKRAFALRDVIFLLIAQQDSRTTKELTRAAKIDSSAMTAIAALTMLFLPATFVATFFGMNFFQFDESQNLLTTSHNAWIFGAIAIPLTIAVFGVWIAWVIVQNKRIMPKDKTSAASEHRPSRPSDLQRVKPGVARYATFSLQNWEEEMAAGPCYPIKKSWEQLEVAVPDPG